jgi:hypothetical protein
MDGPEFQEITAKESGLKPGSLSHLDSISDSKKNGQNQRIVLISRYKT